MDIPASNLPFSPIDQPRLAHVMNIVVTCSNPLPYGSQAHGSKTASKDGKRDVFWPIRGGRFYGPKISGKVVSGGADFPVIRPDGVLYVDAFYRLETDDGTSIVIHNQGVEVEAAPGEPRKFRLQPKFTTVEGPHEWLNKGVFVATLVLQAQMPEELKLAKEGENDRLIQVYQIA